MGHSSYLWMHIAAFIVLISPLGRKAGQWVESAKTATITAGFVILAFVGTMMQHLTGGILYEVVLGQITHTDSSSSISRNLEHRVLYLPVGKISFNHRSSIVGVPVIRILKKSLFPPETKQFQVKHRECQTCLNNPKIVFYFLNNSLS